MELPPELIAPTRQVSDVQAWNAAIAACASAGRWQEALSTPYADRDRMQSRRDRAKRGKQLVSGNARQIWDLKSVCCTFEVARH